MNRLPPLRVCRILLWLFMLAAGLDKEGDAMMLRTSSFQPIPRNRLMTDNFFESMAGGKSFTGRSLPVSNVVGYVGASGPSIAGGNNNVAGNFQNGGTFEKPKAFQSFSVYPGYGSGSFGNPFNTGNSPFKDLFGSDIGKPSSLSASVSKNSPTENMVSYSSGGTNTRIGQPDFEKSAKHPFSSIRLTPITRVTGISSKSPNFDKSNFGFGGGDLLKQRNQLFSESNRAENFNNNNPFEKPIQRNTFPLPDVNKPISLDLADDERKRVQFLRENRKLPPSRNFANGVNKELPGKSSFVSSDLPGQQAIDGFNKNRKLTLPPLPPLPSEQQKQGQNKHETFPFSTDNEENKSPTSIGSTMGKVSKQDDEDKSKTLNRENSDKLDDSPNDPVVLDNTPDTQTSYDYDYENDHEDPPDIHTYLGNGANQDTSNTFPEPSRDRGRNDDANDPENSLDINQAYNTPNNVANDDVKSYTGPVNSDPSGISISDTSNVESPQIDFKTDSEDIDKSDKDMAVRSNNVVGNDRFHNGDEMKQGKYDFTVLTDEKITKVPKKSDTEPAEGEVTTDYTKGNNPAVKRVIQRTIVPEGEKVVRSEKRLPTDHIGFILTDDIYDDSSDDSEYVYDNEGFNPEKEEHVGNIEDKSSQLNTRYKNFGEKRNSVSNEILPTSTSGENLQDNSFNIDSLGNISPHGNNKPLTLDIENGAPPAVGSGYLRWPDINMAAFSSGKDVEARHPSEIFSPDDSGHLLSHQQRDERAMGQNPGKYDGFYESKTDKFSVSGESLDTGTPRSELKKNIDKTNEHNIIELGLDHEVEPKLERNGNSEKGVLSNVRGFEKDKSHNKLHKNTYNTNKQKDIDLGLDMVQPKVERDEYFEKDALFKPDSDKSGDNNEESNGSVLITDDNKNLDIPYVNNGILQKDDYEDFPVNPKHLPGSVDDNASIHKEKTIIPQKYISSDVNKHNFDHHGDILDDNEVLKNIEKEGLKLGIMREADSPMHDKESVEDNQLTPTHDDEAKENNNPLTNKDNFSHETDEHEHINLDNMDEYLEQSNENDIIETRRDENGNEYHYPEYDKEIDENGIPNFSDYSYDNFGKSNILKVNNDDVKGKNEDDFSINTDPISSQFDVLNAGDKSVSIRKVSDTFNNNNNNSNSLNGKEMKELPGMNSKMADASLKSNDDDSMAPDTEGPNDSSKDRREDDAIKLAQDDTEGQDATVLLGGSKAEPEMTKENEKEEETDDDKEKHFKPASSYENYDFATPSSDAFSAQSAFLPTESSPTSVFSAPFESLFGKTRTTLEDGDSFGSLFQNINQDFRKNSLSGKDRSQKNGEDKRFGAFEGRDSLFDRRLGEIIDRRPSLSLFSRRKRSSDYSSS